MIAMVRRALSPVAQSMSSAGSLTIADWRLLAEALATLAGASLAVRVLPFRMVGRLCGQALGTPPPGAGPHPTKRICWAVEACARRVPWRAVCFQKGVAAHLMLRRRGVASTLHFGARPDTEHGVAAHVWVRIGSDDVIGCEIAPQFALLARFPPASA